MRRNVRRLVPVLGALAVAGPLAGAQTANQKLANGPIPGDVGLYASELACVQKLPTPGKALATVFYFLLPLRLTRSNNSSGVTLPLTTVLKATANRGSAAILRFISSTGGRVS